VALSLSTAPLAFVAPVTPTGARSAVQMADYDRGVSFELGPGREQRFSNAPAGMGLEYVNLPRKPLSEYVGASIEFCAYPGAPDEPVAWDPFNFCELYKISGNNPDVAWLREAELKHGRMAMLAVFGIIVQSSGVHLPGNEEVSFADTNWVTAPSSLPPAAWGQVIAFIGLVEGQKSAGLYDLWNGQTDKREPGDYGWGKDFLSKDPVAADKMRLKELKNGRLAMIAFMGIAMNHFIPGALPGCMYN